MSLSCCFCWKGLVAEEVGYRSDERDMSVDRVACLDSPTGRHEIADQMVRIPVEATTEHERNLRTGDRT